MKKRETIFLLCDLMCVYRDKGDNIHRLFVFGHYELGYDGITLVAEEGKYLVSNGSYADLRQEEGFEEFGKYIIMVGNGEEGMAEFFVEKVFWDLNGILEHLLG